MKEIRVTAHGADILPIDALIEFQGNLKTITRANLDKLKRSILKHGFTAPIFVWKGVDNHILDGHQRLKALIEMRQEGYSIPLLPVVYIDADSEAHAKEKLLYITSQYGDFTTEGFAEFVSELDFDFDDVRLTDGEFFVQSVEAEIEYPELNSGDKEPFQQMTFTLADEQAEIVKEAIQKAKQYDIDDSINENSNGNAIAYICEVFLGQG